MGADASMDGRPRSRARRPGSTTWWLGSTTWRPESFYASENTSPSTDPCHGGQHQPDLAKHLVLVSRLGWSTTTSSSGKSPSQHWRWRIAGNTPLGLLRCRTIAHQYTTPRHNKLAISS